MRVRRSGGETSQHTRDSIIVQPWLGLVPVVALCVALCFFLVACAPSESKARAGHVSGTMKGTEATIRAYYSGTDTREYRGAYRYLAARGRPTLPQFYGFYQIVRRSALLKVATAGYTINVPGGSYTCDGIQIAERFLAGNESHLGGWDMLVDQGRAWRIALEGSELEPGAGIYTPTKRECNSLTPMPRGRMAPACRLADLAVSATWQGAG